MVLYHHYQVNPGYLKTIERGPHVQGTFVLFQHNVGLKTYFFKKIYKKSTIAQNCGNSIMYEIAQSSNCCQKATVKSYP